jgi:hypothetical protein
MDSELKVIGDGLMEKTVIMEERKVQNIIRILDSMRLKYRKNAKGQKYLETKPDTLSCIIIEI